MLSAAAATQQLAAQLAFFFVAGGLLGFVKAGSRVSLVAGTICGVLEALLAFWARTDGSPGLGSLAFFNLFLAFGLGRRLLAQAAAAKQHRTALS